MKKLLLLLLIITLSCSSDEEQEGSLQIPDRFVGDWKADDYAIAEITNNKVVIDVDLEQVIVITEGTTTVDNGTTHFEAELPNNERLVLLFSENDEDTSDDDDIGITLFGERYTSAAYSRIVN